MRSDWSQQLAEELHKPITRILRKRRVISCGVDKIWAADLVEIQKYSKWNKKLYGFIDGPFIPQETQSKKSEYIESA